MKELIGQKKLILFCSLILFFFGLFGLASDCLFAQKGFGDDDLKVIRQALASHKLYDQKLRSAPRWLKIWIKDEASQNEEIKISLPIALVDLLIIKAEMERRKKDCSLSIKDDFSFIQDKRWMKDPLKLIDLWTELKKMGPGYLMELKGDSAFVRIWLE